MRTIVAGLAAALLVAGCASGTVSSAGHSSDSGPPAPISVIDPDAAFYIDTLQQWKDYGDAVVTVRVVADRVDPTTPKDPDVNGGLYGRIADLQVTHTFWIRDADHRPPAAFSTALWGWWIKDGARVPIATRGNPRMIPGHSYLVVLDRFPDGWGPAAELPFDNDTVGSGEWLGRGAHDDRPAVRRLLGQDEAGVQRLIDSVRLSAASRRYSGLDPARRAAKIADP
jgi:hypothetical protein